MGEAVYYLTADAEPHSLAAIEHENRLAVTAGSGTQTGQSGGSGVTTRVWSFLTPSSEPNVAGDWTGDFQITINISSIDSDCAVGHPSGGLTKIARVNAAASSQIDSDSGDGTFFTTTGLQSFPATTTLTGTNATDRLLAYLWIRDSRAHGGGTVSATLTFSSSTTVATPFSPPAGASPAAVQATTTVPAPSVSAESTKTPTAVAVAATVPTPTPVVSSPATVAPAAVQASATIPASTRTVEGTAAPAATAAGIQIATPTVSADVTASPSVVTATITVPAPTVDVGSGAQVTPAAIQTAVTIPGPAVLAEAAVTTAAILAAVTVPAATVTTDGSASPATVTSPVSVPTPALEGGTAVAVTAVAVAVTTPSSSPSGDAGVQPGLVTTVAAVDAPTVTIPSTVAPAVLAAAVTVPATIIQVPVDTAPDSITVPVVVPAPVGGAGGVTVHPAAFVVFVAVPKPTILGLLVAIRHRQSARFYRRNGRLALMPLGRSQARGMRAGEGWETVSDLFVMNTGEADQVMGEMAAVWAAHQGSDQATLTAAVNGRLQALGYRRVGGGALV